MIAIVSKDKDFSQEIAQHIARELDIACEWRTEMGAESADLILADAPGFSHATLPVIALSPPVRMAQLLADIKARLASGNENIRIGGYVFSTRSKILVHTRSEKSVNLTDKEAALLENLAQADKAGMGKDALLKNIWGIEADLNTHTLETHIYRLRSKFKEIFGAEMIEAFEGGYRLVE